jgi:hypothetical protein
MARFPGKKRTTEAAREEAARIAQSTRRAGQTKEQTKLIEQGIQQGIELYKKQQSAKARELDRKLRKAQRAGDDEAVARAAPTEEVAVEAGPRRGRGLLPWLLLALTWAGIGMYLLSPSLPALLAG